MKRWIAFGLLILLNGCATIISGSDDQLTVNSTPNNIPFTILNKHGRIVHRGQTPEVVNLPRKAGYFEGERYSVLPTDQKAPQRITTVESSLNPWYFGNIIFGGLIGGVFVDPITGAMWELDDNVDIVGK